MRFLKLTWTNDDHAHHPPAFRSVGSESNTNYHGNMLFAARNLTGAGIEQILGYVPMIEIMHLLDRRMSARCPTFACSAP